MREYDPTTTLSPLCCSSWRAGQEPRQETGEEGSFAGPPPRCSPSAGEEE
jgi:hypothetical protein